MAPVLERICNVPPLGIADTICNPTLEFVSVAVLAENGASALLAKLRTRKPLSARTSTSPVDARYRPHSRPEFKTVFEVHPYEKVELTCIP
jgi:hypothetical protein